MSSEKWEKVRLGDISNKITKGTTPTTMGFPFVEEGVNFIKAESVTMEGRIDPSKFVFITEAVHEKLKRSQLEEGDILFSMAGVVLGKTAIVGEEFLPANTNQALALIRLNKALAYPEFVHYFLQQQSIFEYVNSMSAQSAQPNINLEEIGGLQISLPPLSTQRRIAGILTALDDKIELNRQMNVTLEGIAQTIWQEWFGKYSSGEEELPEGWRWGTVLDIAKLIGGGTPKTDIEEYWNGEIPWISGKDITPNNNSIIIQTEKSISQKGLENSSAKLLPAYSTIVSARGTVGNYCLIPSEMTISQSNYALKSTMENADYFLFKQVGNIVSEMQQKSYGTVFDTITTKTFSEIEIPLPPSSMMVEYDVIAKPIFEKIYGNLVQSRTLAALRDALLPRLMRGEINLS